MTDLAIAPLTGPEPGPRRAAPALREAARALEASFLSVMLQSAGLGAPREAMGGGVGEAQFASFLTEAHARSMVERGGIGLAESLYRALVARAEPAQGQHDMGARDVRV
jgi:Rod binding domain-containing protein